MRVVGYMAPSVFVASQYASLQLEKRTENSMFSDLSGLRAISNFYSLRRSVGH
jgi:hypothetical protein